MPCIVGLYSPAPQSGKSFIARILVAEHGFQLLPFAQPLRAMLWPLLRSLGLDDQQIRFHLCQDKAAIIPGLGCSGRHLMQTLGTDWGRTLVHHDLWLECWAAEAGRQDGGAVVVDDLRFPNEARMIQQLGGTVWRIVRPGQSRGTDHASEGALDTWDGFSQTITNDGDLAKLSALVARALPYPPSPAS